MMWTVAISIILLSLYDIIVAFHTVDHTIHLNLLFWSFDIVDSALLGSIHSLPSWPSRRSRCNGWTYSGGFSCSWSRVIR